MIGESARVRILKQRVLDQAVLLADWRLCHTASITGRHLASPPH